MNIDLVELGSYCQNRYRESLDSKKDHYLKTLFFAIKNEDEIFVSTTPHILKNANKCILIHERSSLAVTNWYIWYKIEVINENGEVFDELLDNDFSLIVYGGYCKHEICLRANKTNYYKAGLPFENSVKKIWRLYCRLRETESDTERSLISSNFNKDEKILELEKKVEDFSFTKILLEEERDNYKNLLNEIEKTLSFNSTN